MEHERDVDTIVIGVLSSVTKRVVKGLENFEISG